MSSSSPTPQNQPIVPQDVILNSTENQSTAENTEMTPTNSSSSSPETKENTDSHENFTSSEGSSQPSKKRKRVETPPSPPGNPPESPGKQVTKYFTEEDMKRLESKYKLLLQAQEQEVARLKSHLKGMEDQMNRYVDAIKKRTGMNLTAEEDNTDEKQVAASEST